WLQGLVENLLCIALIDEGQFNIQPRTIALDEVVGDAGAVVEPILAQKRQKIRLFSQADLPCVQADPIRLSQVMVNLLLNASKYSPAGTSIDVRLARGGPGLRVAVLDRGVGIVAGEEEQLFDAFHRAPTGEPGTIEGIGL